MTPEPHCCIGTGGEAGAIGQDVQVSGEVKDRDPAGGGRGGECDVGPDLWADWLSCPALRQGVEDAEQDREGQHEQEKEHSLLERHQAHCQADEHLCVQSVLQTVQSQDCLERDNDVHCGKQGEGTG